MKSSHSKLAVVVAGALVLLVTGGLANRETRGAETASPVTPWITSDTVLVAEIELGQIDPPSLRQALEGVLPDELKSVPAAAAMIDSITAAGEGWIASAKAAGIRQILAVASASLDTMKQSPVFLVLPDNPRVNEETLRELFAVSDGSPLQQISRMEPNGPIVIGASGLLEELEAQPRGDAGRFESALAEVRKFPIRVAFAPSDDHRRVIREMFPQLPAPLSAWNGKTLADGLLWKAVGMTLTPNIRIHAEVCSQDAQAARELMTAWSQLVDFVLQRPELAAYKSRIEAVARQIAPRQQESRLRVDLNADGVRSIVRLALPAIKAARVAAARQQNLNQIKQLALAMLNYESANGHYPDCAIRDEEGRPLLSWRVAVLPYLVEMPLYEQFHLDEPWDSAHNRKLIDRMPAVFRSPGSSLIAQEANSANRTTFLVPVGEGLVFGSVGGSKIRDITDGASRTLLLVQVPQDDAVVWTQPTDWTPDLDQPKLGLLVEGREGCVVARCDGSAQWMDASIDADRLRALLTIAGEEVVE